jgi:hypothetical protein
MTWLEIIDTSIKIGLGALIGGVFSYLLNRQMYVHAVRKEVLLDNRHVLKDVSATFEGIHARVIALDLEVVREYDTYIREFEKYSDTKESAKSNSKLKVPKKPDFHSRRLDATEKLILELYSLQGILLLYGYKKMSSVIYDYTSNVSAISPISRKESQADIIEPLGIEKFNELRVEFYEAANYYLSNQNSG